ncbi:MAG: hypothetical protein J0L82_02230 [Deltaproteobacteria bacterium]|nr:hypothetical protein [Deltaproteobacteria bacterium]
MNTRNQIIFVLAVSVCAGISASCGVKGKPLPPLEPAHIGRGAPTYKRTAEQARPTIIPTPTPTLTPDGRGR